MHLAEPLVRGPLIEAVPDAVLVRVPAVGRYLVRAGAVTVERMPDATDADVRCFLDEPVAAAAALLDGELPLRAAAVAVGGRAVAICGPPAAGKSVLAAALARRGHGVLADAVVVLARSPRGGAPLVRPLAPEPVLWPDSAEELGLAVESGRPVRPALAKRAYPFAAEGGQVPLAAVVSLDPRVNCTEPQADRVAGPAKLGLLLGARWHAPLARPLGREPTQFAILAGVLSGATCVRLVRPHAGAPAADLARIVEAVVG
jgi:hypothetical protein